MFIFNRQQIFFKNTIENVPGSNDFNLLLRRVELWNFFIHFLRANDDLTVLDWWHEVSAAEFDDLFDITLILKDVELQPWEERVAITLTYNFSVENLRELIDLNINSMSTEITSISETYLWMKYMEQSNHLLTARLSIIHR